MDFIEKIKRSKLGDLRRWIRRKTQRARISNPHFRPSRGLEGGRPFLYVVDSSFNQSVPNASVKIGTGFVRGWAKAVGPAKFVDVRDLISELKNFDKPVVCMSIYHLSNLSYEDCRKLNNVDVCIWVSIHPKKVYEYEKRVLGADSGVDTNVWLENYGKVMAIRPKFVWNSASNDGMEWYRGWVDDGLRWETIQLAADDDVYFPDRNEKKFGNIKMAYIGGYWPEKAQAFDKYLRPFEDILWVFGYVRWPYKNYGGQVGEEEERQIYSTAKIIPLVTSPAGWLTTEITERYFKAPACEAFCISDENPALREIFTKEEMLQAESAEHFKELVSDALNGRIDMALWAKRAHDATLKRHLYSHRAMQILAAMER